MVYVKTWTPKIAAVLALLLSIALVQHCTAQRCQCQHQNTH